MNWESQEAFYGRDIIVADRETVESFSDDILAGADTADVAFLVVGDPFGYGTNGTGTACSSPRICLSTSHN
jgi:diphthine methyl ester synthase